MKNCQRYGAEKMTEYAICDNCGHKVDFVGMSFSDR